MLDREERSDFLVGGAEHADRGDNDQQDQVSGRREHAANQRHEQRPEDQHPPPPVAIRGRGDPQGNDRVAQERHGQQETNLSFRQSQRLEVQHQHHGERAIGEHPEASGREQEPPVCDTAMIRSLSRFDHHACWFHSPGTQEGQ